MGWASGGTLADEIWDVVFPHLPKEVRPKIAKEIIDSFEGRDCDTMMETQLWECANEPCPACKQEDGIIDSCDICEGWGWVARELE